MNEQFDFNSKTAIKSYNLEDKIRYQLALLDSLDAFTRRHSENVANITCRLCEYLKMDEGFTIYCTTCAYIHDIGKLFIPPEILQKTSKLTEAEFEVMKTHTTIGYKMCMKDPKLTPYAAGTLYHHESLNGTGYPYGVTAKDIPYEAQIIRVADEFEAITAVRQYKTHVGIVDALKILIDHAQPEITKNHSLKTLSDEVRYGKVDKNIVRALFKVVVDDIEYEISSRYEYINYLKEEIKRLETAMRCYNKMEAAMTESKKEYYKAYAAGYLRPHEKVELIPQTLQEFKDSLKAREEHIEKLYSEARQVKHLTV